MTQESKPWSQEITAGSAALDLEEGVFTWSDPRAIAESLARSADASTVRKGTPLQSAMGMLNFYINRAGDSLSDDRREVLEQAKDELRALYGKRRRRAR